MSEMSEAEQRATLAVALMAAFADGMRDERERAAVESLVGQLEAQRAAPDSMSRPFTRT